MSADEADRHCLEDPAGVITSPPTVKCSKKYCFIERIEYTDPKGQISSFIRGCTSGEDIVDGETVSDDSITYYRSCSTNLCNIGDGTQPLSDGMDPDSANKIHGTIYAPGIGASVISAKLTSSWLLIVTFLTAYFAHIFTS
ncbi:uncharacterized protein LOC124169552 [Ischnura elegans]|uniref:uncharacterized protein LOC124169552 n=1 Tax=Ischnura elegans TaxID=197161 RepID=UPI001ED8BDF8|nr:uncharacterized protein LOC124169552 [Ischnura elegans]